LFRAARELFLVPSYTTQLGDSCSEQSLSEQAKLGTV